MKILNKVHEWAIKNEMTFGINNCATIVVKPINFVKPINYAFFIDSDKLPKTDNYTYLPRLLKKAYDSVPIFNILIKLCSPSRCTRFMYK